MDDGFPVIRPRNIKEHGFDLSDLDYVSEQDFRLLTDKHAPSDGDIVFSRNASFGVSVYVENMWPFCIGQDVVVMTKSSADSRFVYFALKSDRTTRQINNASAGSTFGRINLRAIRGLLIALPRSLDEQEAISVRMANWEDALRQDREQLEKLRALKSALMRDLLTGKKRVYPLFRQKEQQREKVYA